MVNNNQPTNQLPDPSAGLTWSVENLTFVRLLQLSSLYIVQCTLCTEHYRVGVYGADSCLRNMKLARGKSSPWNRKLWPAHNLNSTSVLAGDQNSFLLPNRSWKCIRNWPNRQLFGEQLHCEKQRNIKLQLKQLWICIFPILDSLEVATLKEKPSPAPLNCEACIWFFQEKYML